MQIMVHAFISSYWGFSSLVMMLLAGKYTDMFYFLQGMRGGSAIGSPQAELTTPQMQQRLTAARRTPSLMHNLDTRLKDVRQSSK